MPGVPVLQSVPVRRDGDVVIPRNHRGWWAYTYPPRSMREMLVCHRIWGPHGFTSSAWQDGKFRVTVLDDVQAMDVEKHVFMTEGVVALLCPECLYSRIDGGVS